MEYYSVLKRNELSNHEEARRTLKCTLLSESQCGKAAHCTTQLWDVLGKAKLWRQCNDQWSPGVEERERQTEQVGFLGQ